MADFHPVKIFDAELCAFVKDNIRKRDSVIIEGRLNHDFIITAEGKKEFSGYIVAEKLWKKLDNQNRQQEDN